METWDLKRFECRLQICDVDLSHFKKKLKLKSETQLVAIPADSFIN
jgi:hypothetical protein